VYWEGEHQIYRNHTINKEQSKFAGGDLVVSDVTGKLCVHDW